MRLLTTATESTARVTASAASSTAPATTVTARTDGSDRSAAYKCALMTLPAGMAARARKCDVSTPYLQNLRVYHYSQALKHHCQLSVIFPFAMDFNCKHFLLCGNDDYFDKTHGKYL